MYSTSGGAGDFLAVAVLFCDGGDFFACCAWTEGAAKARQRAREISVVRFVTAPPSKVRRTCHRQEKTVPGREMFDRIVTFAKTSLSEAGVRKTAGLYTKTMSLASPARFLQEPCRASIGQ